MRTAALCFIGFFVIGCTATPIDRVAAPRATPAGFERGEAALQDEADAQAIDTLCERSRATIERLRDEVLASDDRHVASSLAALDRAGWIAAMTAGVTSDFHPDAAIRGAASTCGTRIDQLLTRAQTAMLPRLKAARGLAGDDAKYVRSIVLAAERDGANLPEGHRHELDAARARADELTAQIRGVIGTPSPLLVVPASRLGGLPQAFAQAHRADAKGNVALDPIADASIVALNATDRALAAELRDARLRLPAEKNVEPLRELLETRRRAATLLGFTSFANAAAASRMVGTAARTEQFLTEMTAGIRQLNATYARALGIADGAPPPATDLDWLENRLRAKRGEANAAPWLAYFEVESTVGRVLDAIGEATGLRFAHAAPPPWPRDAIAYDVFRGDTRVGRFIFDLYLRPGKVPGTGSSYPIVARTHGSDPNEAVDVLISTTIPRAAGGAPTTFPSSRHITTLVHELGHSIDFLFERESILAPAEQDFFDVPSQLMERWTLDPAFLQRIGHDTRSGEPLPLEGATAIARDVAWTRWWRVRYTTLVAWLDVRFHGEQPVDPAKAYENTYRGLFPFTPEPGHPEAALFMPTVAYPGNAHALIWGLAISTDLARSFGPAGLSNRQRWEQFFDQVSGADGPADARIAHFLGRSWSTGPLREEIAGIVSSVAGDAVAR